MRLEEVRGGAWVFIHGPGDDQFPQKYLGRVGRIRAVDISECGATRLDPMLMVAVDGIGTDGFWLEELELIEAPRELPRTTERLRYLVLRRATIPEQRAGFAEVQFGPNYTSLKTARSSRRGLLNTSRIVRETTTREHVEGG